MDNDSSVSVSANPDRFVFIFTLVVIITIALEIALRPNTDNIPIGTVFLCEKVTQTTCKPVQ